MATPDPTITTTPGKNEKVNNVLNIEDVLRKASGGVSDVVSAGSAPSPEQREKLAKIQQLAANLEQELRALRAAMPENSGDPPQREIDPLGWPVSRLLRGKRTGDRRRHRPHPRHGSDSRGRASGGKRLDTRGVTRLTDSFLKRGIFRRSVVGNIGNLSGHFPVFQNL